MENDLWLDRTWAQINLDNLCFNYNELKKLTKHRFGNEKKQNVKMMGVVKANAYGHGSVVIAKVLESEGVDYLAVASLDEAVELRISGIKVPILLLGYVIPNRFEEVIKYDIIPSIFDKALAEKLSAVALKMGKRVKVHVEIDTGMTRLGFNYYNAVEEILFLKTLKGLEIEGVYTHFACADEKLPDYTNIQFERFMSVVKKLELQGIKIQLKHVCNSAATIMYSHMHLDMVRVGLSMYGMYPSEDIKKERVFLKPVMTLKSKIASVNDIGKGVKISYGGIYKTSRDSKIATVPIGYADGLARNLTNKANIIINGQMAPIVGKICMDQCMVDVTDMKGDIKVGDEVVIFGDEQNKKITAEDLAEQLGTINYEITCMISRRVPRYYLKDKKIIDSINFLIKKRDDL